MYMYLSKYVYVLRKYVYVFDMYSAASLKRDDRINLCVYMHTHTYLYMYAHI